MNKNNDHIKKAVALKYDERDNSPSILAKGKGYIADKIVQAGNNKGIYIHKDRELLNSLMKLEIGQEIPPELYEVVAEIIAFVYRLDKEKGEI